MSAFTQVSNPWQYAEGGLIGLTDMERMQAWIYGKENLQGSFGLFQKQVNSFVASVNDSMGDIIKGMNGIGVIYDEHVYKKPSKQYYLQYTDRVNGKRHDRARASNSHVRSDPGFSRKHSRHRSHPRRG